MSASSVLAPIYPSHPYAAVLSLISPAQEALTHDFHMSVLRSCKRGAPVTLRAQVQKCGRTVAFIQVEAKGQDGLLIATAAVTKGIISRPTPP